MSGDRDSRDRIERLVWAGVLEVACIVAGLIAWKLTGSWAWIVIAIVASLGFSVPAVIRFIRDGKGRR